jgi:Ca-activated chloride channel family protein
MRFLHPEYARWIAALAVVPLWYTFRQYRRRAFLDQNAIGARARSASRITSRWREVLAVGCAVLAIALLVVAATRPQLVAEWRTPTLEKRDLLIVLDRSVSMFAKDVQPSRFERALREVKTFLEQKPAGIDRVALVSFANAPIVISHFTNDVDSLLFYLDWMEEDTRPQFGTDIGAALTSASDVIKRDGQPTTKVVLIVSDGDDEGSTLETAVTALRTSGARIYCVGIGGQADVQVAVPADDGVGEAGWKLDVKFAENTLTGVAAAAGGRYYRSTTGHELLSAMQDLASRERRQVGWTVNHEYRDLYPFALAGAALSAGLLLLTL